MMSEKRFIVVKGCDNNVEKEGYFIQDTHYGVLKFGSFWKEKFAKEDCKRLNDVCELIEELHTSDHMGWERADYFEKELKQKKIYIKRLEYKVQKFKEMNNEQQATIENLRKWLIAEQKQVEKRDAFIKQKGLMSEFVKELEDE